MGSIATSRCGRITIRDKIGAVAQTSKPVRLKPQTLALFEEYIHKAEIELEQMLKPSGAFLWSDLNLERQQQIQSGRVLAQFWAGRGPVKASDGLIHDWIAAASIPDTTVTDVLALIQDYDNHKLIYQPEVMDSKLISRQGNDFHIYLRLLKKKIFTVVLDTDHQVHYRSIDRKRWLCRSRTTRIAEV